MESQNRIFVGGIPVRVEKKAIVDFFSQFGTIRHCKVKKNSKTGRSLGYAYITFEDVEATKKILNTPVEFSGRICECKPVLKKEELKDELDREKRKKLLVYELETSASTDDLKGLFGSLTSISHAYVIHDPDSDLNLGYGYVIFNTETELEDFCRRKLSLCINDKKIKYTNRFHVPPKKKSKESKNSASKCGGEVNNRIQSHSSTSNNKDLHIRQDSLDKSLRIQKCSKDQCLIADSAQSETQLVRKSDSFQLASTHAAGFSQESGSKSFFKHSRLQRAANQKDHVLDESEISEQGQFLALDIDIHTFFLKPSAEKDKYGFIGSTKKSREICQMGTKLAVAANKPPKCKLTSTMRDILRASPYTSTRTCMYRLNRSSGRLLY